MYQNVDHPIDTQPAQSSSSQVKNRSKIGLFEVFGVKL